MSLTNALWLVYFAGVADNVSIVVGFTLAGLIVLSVVLTIGMCVNLSDGFPAEAANFRKLLVKSTSAGLVAALILCVIPSSTFIYMTAGISVGSEVLQTELGRKAVSLLEQKLDQALSAEESK